MRPSAVSKPLHAVHLARCDAAWQCDDDGLTAGRQARALVTWSTVAFVAEAVALAASVALVVLAPARRVSR